MLFVSHAPKHTALPRAVNGKRERQHNLISFDVSLAPHFSKSFIKLLKLRFNSL